MTNYELRAKARQDLGGKIFGNAWMMALAAYLIYTLIISACGFVPYVGSIASTLLAGPFIVGMCIYFLKVIRNEEAKIENIFDGFNLIGYHIMNSLRDTDAQLIIELE